MRAALEALGPFDSVLDVGGNVGQSAKMCRELWPSATITSFEPIPALALANDERSQGRWWVVPVAISDQPGSATIHACLDQPSASTMQRPGPARLERFGIRDRFADLEVPAELLDYYLGRARGRSLVKIDVEGHEMQVLDGAPEVLDLAAVVVIECNAPGVFEGAPSVPAIELRMRAHGLFFAGVLDCLKDPAGDVVQFDAVFQRR